MTHYPAPSPHGEDLKNDLESPDISLDSASSIDIVVAVGGTEAMSSAPQQEMDIPHLASGVTTDCAGPTEVKIEQAMSANVSLPDTLSSYTRTSSISSAAPFGHVLPPYDSEPPSCATQSGPSRIEMDSPDNGDWHMTTRDGDTGTAVGPSALIMPRRNHGMQQQTVTEIPGQMTGRATGRPNTEQQYQMPSEMMPLGHWVESQGHLEKYTLYSQTPLDQVDHAFLPNAKNVPRAWDNTSPHLCSNVWAVQGHLAPQSLQQAAEQAVECSHFSPDGGQGLSPRTLPSPSLHGSELAQLESAYGRRNKRSQKQYQQSVTSYPGTSGSKAEVTIQPYGTSPAMEGRENLNPAQTSGHGDPSEPSTHSPRISELDGLLRSPSNIGSKTPPEKEVTEPYAQIIFRAFMEHPRHAMSLQDLYQWFRENSNKAKGPGKGWQNSIRHNLSMNGVSSCLDIQGKPR